MKYENIRRAKFLSRPNRFIANIEIDGRQEICHVKNTGRCRELLVPGAEIYVQEFSASLSRKTKYDLISVNKNGLLINIDSAAPNKAAQELILHIFPDLKLIKPECTYGNSRFDFYVEYASSKAFIEVKGVTLEDNGIAAFPDAPTLRGVKHVNELIKCRRDGYEAYLLFIIQMSGVKYMTPNDLTHPAFGNALREAKKNGVELMAYECDVTKNTITAADSIEVRL